MQDNFLTAEPQPQKNIPDLTEQTTKDITVNIVKEETLLVEDDPLEWGKQYRETIIKK